MISNREFERGDRLLAESPIICCLKGDQSGQNNVRGCANCLKPLYIDSDASHSPKLQRERSIPKLNLSEGTGPCRKGCSVLYCSTVCRDDAWENFHQILCLPLRIKSPAVALRNSQKLKRTPSDSSFLVEDRKRREELTSLHDYLSSHSQNPQLLLTAKILATFKQRSLEGKSIDEVLSPIKFMNGFDYWTQMDMSERPNVSKKMLSDFTSQMEFFQSSHLYHPLYEELLTDLNKYVSLQLAIWLNAFGFSTTYKGMTLRGLCIPKAGVFINHSCKPNTAWRFIVLIRGRSSG
eukprot:TRINITY_DN2025_c0_g1_i1.p1 TRINITY_DN2025_c0_g1~~TRINITY_DN2025_c0_g1_i1.p1  ORF type:complete len:293 (+),score=51.43 TRINITY_DN2025_c0_g1_i1:95-973(+)